MVQNDPIQMIVSFLHSVLPFQIWSLRELVITA